MRRITSIAVLFCAGSCLTACDRPRDSDAPDNAPSQARIVLPGAEPAGATFPLRVEVGKRYLVNAQGRPFFVNGDTAWSLIVQLTREQVDNYLEDRRQRGFNSVLVSLIEHEFAADAPKNAYGDAPFERPGDFGRPNERYFAHADYVIRRAAEKGIVVLLAPAYAGYGGGSQGWYREMRAGGASKLRTYGRYLGHRYSDFSNIVWVHGGDYNVPDKDLVRAVAEGIREFDTKPHTYHGSRGTAALRFWGTGERWLGINNIYTDGASVVAAAHAEYSRSVLPFFLIEAEYEGDKTDGYGVRVQAYQTVLSGATGHVYGNNPVWHFSSGRWSTPSRLSWQEALDSKGARSMTQLMNLFAQRAWWTLRPDVGNELLVDDTGSGADRTVAAVASGGEFAVTYLPRIRSVMLDLRAMQGPRVAVRWIDPSNGTSADVPGSPFASSGTHAFRPDRLNSWGEEDWVLLLESVPQEAQKQRKRSR